jgi:hypothetical protein
VRKLIGLALLTTLAMAMVGQPAQASHPGAITVTHVFAGTCGGTPNEGDVAGGGCAFGSDPIWDATGPVLGPTNCQGGATVSGCGPGVYVPGFGPPIVRPSTPFNPTANCADGFNVACWGGGNFYQNSTHSAAVCQSVQADAATPASDCENWARGSFFRSPTVGVGAYSGSSEGCGRIITTIGATKTVADLGWIQSAGTMLPITMRLRLPAHTGSSVFALTNARPIRNELGEPPGLGNGGLPSATDPELGPGKSGTRRFGVTGIAVTLPNNGPLSVGGGDGSDLYCPTLSIG